MNKVTVTKKEMSAIEAQRDMHAKGLKNVLSSLLNGAIFHSESAPINDMTAEQIVLAWHGHVEVEPEYISFEEAFRAFKDRKKITLHYPNGKKDWFSHVLDWQQREVSPSFHEMVNGKWTIEGDNQ